MITPVSRGDARQRDVVDGHGDGQLNPSHHIIQSPPTKANGRESMTIKVSVMDLKFRYSSRKMIVSRVTGTTIFRRAAARRPVSNWPLQIT